MHDKINQFISNTVNTIKCDKIADEFKLELEDHIEQLVGDLINDGYSDEDAIDEALLRLGDPKEISTSLNKVSSTSLLDFFTQKALYLQYILLSLYLLFEIFTCIINKSFFSLVFTCLLGIILISFFKILKNKNKNTNDSKILLYIRYEKRRSSYEKILIGFLIFYSILLIPVFIGNFVESLSSQKTFNISSIFPIFILIVSFLPSLINSNNTISEKGITCNSNFIPWENISNYRFGRSYTKKGIVHELQIVIKNGHYSIPLKIRNEQKLIISELIQNYI